MTTRTKPLPRKERILKGRELNRGLQRGRGSENKPTKRYSKKCISWIDGY